MAECRRCGAVTGEDGVLSHTLLCISAVWAEYGRRGCPDCGVAGVGLLHGLTCKAWARELIDGCILDDTATMNTDVRHALTPKAPDPATHDATVTLPYGFTLPIPSASEKKLDELKEAEDQILDMLADKPKWFHACVYKYLHHRGLRMTDVDDLIRRRAK